ncbi:MAG: T9SS type B sorting domain-containing protein [Bacteroidota bacterium]
MKTLCKSISTIVIIAALWCSAKAQENNNWAFGTGYGLNFSNDSASFVSTNSASKNGSASISDSAGNLILYYDNWNVYDRTHSIIENGDTLIPHPGDLHYIGGQNSFFLKSQTKDNRYFLVVGGSMDFQLNTKEFKTGLFIYKIDISPTQNKSKLDTNYTCYFLGSPFSSISATQHKNGKDIWVICRMGIRWPRKFNDHNDFDTLVTFLFSDDSLTLKYINKIPYRENTFSANRTGGPTFSNSGHLIAESFSDVGYYFPYAGSDSAKSYIALMDFDNETGVISNRRMLHYYADKVKLYSGDLPSSINKREYNYDGRPVFSENDSFLYILDERNKSTEHVLVQFPLFSSDPINESSFFTFTNGIPYSIGLGPDDKLYICYLDYDLQTRWRIAVIDFPNRQKSINSVNLGAFIISDSSNKSTAYNFPIQVYKNKKPKFVYQTFDCIQNNTLHNISNKIFTTFDWYINDSLFKQTNGINDVTLPASNSGIYTIILRGKTPYGWSAWYNETIDFLAPPKATFDDDTSIGCQYVAFEFKNFSNADTVKSTGGYSHWFFGDGTDTVITGTKVPDLISTVSHTYTKSGVYSVRLIFNNGFCSDTIEKINSVVIKPAPRPGITPSKIVGCQPLEVTFKRSYIDTIVSLTYSFSDGSPAETPPIQNSVDATVAHTFNTPGKYFVLQSITGSTGCVTTDSTQITIWKGFAPNEFPTLLYSTIQGDSCAVISWEPFDASVKYQLYRSQNKSQWELVAGFLPTTIEYLDEDIKPNSDRYWYKLSAYDTCDKMVESNFGSTILLSGKRINNDYSILEWNPYEEWDAGVLEYRIETLDKATQWKTVANVGGLSYSDYSFSDESGIEKCYRISAVENGSNGALSTSNSICIPYSPTLWIPTGFTPNNDGKNDIFSITSLGIDYLKVSIYDIYGELIYSCEGIDCNWDGTYKGQALPLGSYMYIVNAKTVEKKNINERGTITLVR